MVNEFHNLELLCVPPQLVPPYGNPENQGCILPGAVPGSTVVDGEAYLYAQLQYSYSHLWRNVGIIIAFWAFFGLMTLFGFERKLEPSKAGTVDIYKRGKERKPSDEEAQRENIIQHERKEISQAGMQRFAQSGLISWERVGYAIDANGKQKFLLTDISGYVKPGRMTALMGGITPYGRLTIESGAGKTTLLNCLAQRATGVVTGQILIDGGPLPKSFQRCTGYVQQVDVHEPTSTVREALQFSALLRRPNTISVKEKYAYVEEIIKLLELEDVDEAIVGTDGAGLSSERRKRLTIAVELASKPELLIFLDEPTSGIAVVREC